ncbi:MAG TPA: TrbC/VirB2 family protein [Phenylobacterium sp.]|jgi:type IV secretion system protein VirB2
MTRNRHRTPSRPAVLALPALVAAGAAHAQSVGDPAGSSPLIAALDWVQGTLLGNLATAAAVIAVAAVGFMMLTGRMDWRRGLTVVIGCFIIFGAVSIVAGIRGLAGGLH